ncbi:hypothetical protein [Shewanella donghaensis]|uniref:hypothetical protein n=1 Tax=Shewanella donghaensis TaxID=238836 RepID=UPI0011832FBD|nr:hypothetical protein [Shewanella donghaensis]
MKKIIPIITLIPLLLCASSQLLAQEKNREMRKPPQEAFTACEDKTEEEVVTFTTPNGDEMEAKCMLLNDELVAVPKDHTPPQRSRSRG